MNSKQVLIETFLKEPLIVSSELARSLYLKFIGRYLTFLRKEEELLKMKILEVKEKYFETKKMADSRFSHEWEKTKLIIRKILCRKKKYEKHSFGSHTEKLIHQKNKK